MTEQAPLATALEYAPIIERVHGGNHPELTRVRELTERLGAGSPDTDVAEIFRELRQLTDDYAIPDDVCETFTATYESLAHAEAAMTGTGATR